MPVPGPVTGLVTLVKGEVQSRDFCTCRRWGHESSCQDQGTQPVQDSKGRSQGESVRRRGPTGKMPSSGSRASGVIPVRPSALGHCVQEAQQPQVTPHLLDTNHHLLWGSEENPHPTQVFPPPLEPPSHLPLFFSLELPILGSNMYYT